MYLGCMKLECLLHVYCRNEKRDLSDFAVDAASVPVPEQVLSQSGLQAQAVNAGKLDSKAREVLEMIMSEVSQSTGNKTVREALKPMDLRGDGILRTHQDLKEALHFIGVDLSHSEMRTLVGYLGDPSGSIHLSRIADALENAFSLQCEEEAHQQHWRRYLCMQLWLRLPMGRHICRSGMRTLMHRRW